MSLKKVLTSGVVRVVRRKNPPEGAHNTHYLASAIFSVFNGRQADGACHSVLASPASLPDQRMLLSAPQSFPYAARLSRHLTR
jgi:hypothetical protein